MTRGSRGAEVTVVARAKLAALLGAAGALLAACGGGGSAPPAPAGDPQLAEGREVYAGNCARVALVGKRGSTRPSAASWPVQSCAPMMTSGALSG